MEFGFFLHFFRAGTRFTLVDTRIQIESEKRKQPEIDGKEGHIEKIKTKGKENQKEITSQANIQQQIFR